MDPEGVQSISRNSQSFLAMDVNNWNDNRMQEWTVTVERELMRNTVLKLSYTGNHGSNLQQHWDVNSPMARYNYQAATGNLAPTNGDLRRINPNWNLTGSYGVLQHNGYSNANSVQANIERRFTGGLAFQAFYVYTHVLTTNDTGGYSYGPASISSNTTSGLNGGSATSVPENIEILGNPNSTPEQRLRLAYTNSSQVPPHRVSWNGIWELPFGKGKKFGSNSGWATNALIGGWQIAFIGTLEQRLLDGCAIDRIHPEESLFERR